MAESPDTGISVSELIDRDHPIPISARCVTGFIGRCRSGPVNRAIEISGTGEFARVFGGAWSGSLLPDAVEQYFRHGGLCAVVVRVANAADGAEIVLPGASGSLELVARNPGSGERLRAAVDYDAIQSGAGSVFNLTVQRLAGSSNRISDQEIFRRVSVDPDAENYVANELARSTLVRVKGEVAGHLPAATGGLDGTGDGSGYVTLNTPGTDGQQLTDYDLIGSVEEATGLFALNAAETLDFLYAPPATREASHGPAFYAAAEGYCLSRLCMLIADPAAGDPGPSANYRLHCVNPLESSHVTTYFPRPLQRRGARGAVPIGAALAGVLARETEAGSIAAGFDKAKPALARDYYLDAPLPEDVSRACSRAGINALLQRPDGRLMPASSLTTACGLYDDVSSLHVSRLVMFVRRALERNTRWLVFGDSPERLWRRLELQVEQFLQALCAAGAIRGNAAGGRNFVHCNTVTNARLDPAEHITRFLVGFTPADLQTPIVLSITQAPSAAQSARTAFAAAAEF